MTPMDKFLNPMDGLLGAVEWVPVDQVTPDEILPHVTHTGKLVISGFEFTCYQLSNGARVLDHEDVCKFFSTNGAEE